MTNQIQSKNDKIIRINKFLAQAGFGSRRGVEFLVEEKKVKINNKTAKLSDKVDVLIDVVEVDGKVIKQKEKLVYFAVNKPIGYTSTVRDENAEKVVTDLVPKDQNIFPVGRLDKNSRGLIILTNDGELTNKLTHPKYAHEKEYEVKIIAKTQKLKSSIDRLKKGVRLEEGLAKADKIEIINIEEKRNFALIKIVLHQGWKRQIRRMCQRVELEVIDLKRIRIGKLALGNLNDGNFNIVSRSDII